MIKIYIKNIHNFIFLEIGCIGHPGFGSKFYPAMINFFYKNNIKIKDIASGIKFNIALAGKNNLKKLNSFK